eukprot:c21092_g1_i1.p1 GENE.c21092_g1_i1~~c21092_g1_i1.p1  ORF type:complete len:421 (+),score=58.52 c21092_g1_i1:602-1864(+)
MSTKISKSNYKCHHCLKHFQTMRRRREHDKIQGLCVANRIEEEKNLMEEDEENNVTEEPNIIKFTEEEEKEEKEEEDKLIVNEENNKMVNTNFMIMSEIVSTLSLSNSSTNYLINKLQFFNYNLSWPATASALQVWEKYQIQQIIFPTEIPFNIPSTNKGVEMILQPGTSKILERLMRLQDLVTKTVIKAMIKFHQSCHWEQVIRRFGMPSNFNSETFESAHKYFIKKHMGNLGRNVEGTILFRDQVSDLHIIPPPPEPEKQDQTYVYGLMTKSLVSELEDIYRQVFLTFKNDSLNEEILRFNRFFSRSLFELGNRTGWIAIGNSISYRNGSKIVRGLVKAVFQLGEEFFIVYQKYVASTPPKKSKRSIMQCHFSCFKLNNVLVLKQIGSEFIDPIPLLMEKDITEEGNFFENPYVVGLT